MADPVQQQQQPETTSSSSPPQRRWKSGILMNDNGAVPTSKYHHDAPLYGGALTTDIPQEFFDASTIRDIPDHQEVLLLKDGQCSIVIEIVERAAPPTHPCTTDMEALEYHYKDMTSNEYTNSERNNGEVTNVWHKDSIRLLGFPDTPCYFITATQTPYLTTPPPEGSKPAPILPEFTWIEMTLIRLEKQETDLLLSVNIPVMAGSYAPEDMQPDVGRVPYWVEKGCEWSETLRNSLEVRDWGLFGGQ